MSCISPEETKLELAPTHSSLIFNTRESVLFFLTREILQLFLFHSFAARPRHGAVREKTRSTTHRCPIRGEERGEGRVQVAPPTRTQVARVEDTRADRLNAVKKREARVEKRVTSISLHKFVSIFFFFFTSLCTRSFFFCFTWLRNVSSI